MSKSSSRLLSLDVLRGITIAGMITVNNPGSWAHIYAPLRHAAWNGLTPTDLVFPFFVFCMGFAMFISLQKKDFKLSVPTLWHIIYRGLLLILIGWFLNWFGIGCRSLANGESLIDAIWYNPISRLRFMGVLPRLGIVSILSALLLLLFKPRNAWIVSGILLIIYCIIIGTTHSFDLDQNNIVGIVDRAILGEDHMYHLGGIAFDPEGILSTIPCIAHCLLGSFAAYLAIDSSSSKTQMLNMIFVFSAVTILCGFCLDYAFPINKSLWSASYTLVTCGLAALLLGLLIWIIDYKGKRKWSVFFESFGVNPLFIFALSGILANIMNSAWWHTDDKAISMKGWLYQTCLSPIFGETLGSLIFALLFVCMLWGLAYPLYKKHIYIKL